MSLFDMGLWPDFMLGDDRRDVRRPVPAGTDPIGFSLPLALTRGSSGIVDGRTRRGETTSLEASAVFGAVCFLS